MAEFNESFEQPDADIWLQDIFNVTPEDFDGEITVAPIMEQMLSQHFEESVYPMFILSAGREGSHYGYPIPLYPAANNSMEDVESLQAENFGGYKLDVDHLAQQSSPHAPQIARQLAEHSLTTLLNDCGAELEAEVEVYKGLSVAYWRITYPDTDKYHIVEAFRYHDRPVKAILYYGFMPDLPIYPKLSLAKRIGRSILGR